MSFRKQLGRWILGLKKAEIDASLFKEHDTLLANQKRLETDLRILRIEIYDLINEKIIPLEQKIGSRIRRQEEKDKPAILQQPVRAGIAKAETLKRVGIQI